MGIFSEKNETPRFSLITVNFQSATAIGRMLRSFPPEFLTDVEVLVINNDLSESRLLHRMFDQQNRIRVIDLEKNVGFGRACNRGAHEAKGKLLLFLNPDTRFSAGSLADWAAELSSDVKTLSAPLVMHDQEEEVWSSGKTISPTDILLKNIFPWARFWSWYARLASPDWVSGAVFMMHREDFMALNGFDESFFLYYEDVDLCRRAQMAGLTIGKSHQAVFTHQGGLSHASHSSQKQAYFRSQDLYVDKYYGQRWAAVMRLLRSVRQAISSSL